jgi:hypothetical protein
MRRYSITSLARASTDEGIVRPIALALPSLLICWRAMATTYGKNIIRAQGYMSGFNSYSYLVNKNAPFDLGAASPEAQSACRPRPRSMSPIGT